MKHYDEARVVNQLNRRPGVSVANKMVKVIKDNHSCGIRSWGKIDFLIHYCGYRYILTTQSVSSSRPIYINDDIDNSSKKTKKDKFNLVKMVKQAIK